MTERCGDEVRVNSVDRLGRSRLFAGAERALVERCAAAFDLHRIADGTTIVLDGTAERSVHVIRRGAVRIELRGPRGVRLVAGQLREGDAFGVESLLGARPHATFAVCTQSTTLLSAPAAALAGALQASPAVGTNVARIVVEQFDGVAIALDGLRHAALAARIYAVLERLAPAYGVDVADGTLLDVALAADDVAALARCSAIDAETALFFLERDGRIGKNGSLITLLGVSAFS
jgi:CRP-like cAMP-binding protein